MIAVLDYGIGNISSIVNMLRKIGVAATLADDSSIIKKADKIILPGVGSFDSGMKKLTSSGLLDAIMVHAKIDRKPLLGICLGMQMLGRSSEEGEAAGLSLIPFENKRFSFGQNSALKIPHMGWDRTFIEIKNDPLMIELESTPRYYYVHSYYAVCDRQDNVLMRCEYGCSFAAAVKNDNIYGVQFHPEKSREFGMALLSNFARRT